MSPRDVPVVGGERLRVGGEIGVGEVRPTPHNRHDDAARRHWVEVPNLRDTSMRGVWNFLKRGPPTPCRCPRGGPSRAPHLPLPPTFLSHSAPSTDLAVIEIAELSALFFVGNVHHIEIFKGDNVDAESEIHFAISGVAPPVRPTTLWHLLNTAPAWRLPKCSKAKAWSITCPCDCKVCLLVCLLPLLSNWTEFT